MEAAGVVPDVVSFNIAIDACAKSGEVHFAFLLYHRLRHTLGWSVATVNTYTSIIHACGKLSPVDVESAQYIWDGMQISGGVWPNEVTATAMIQVCCLAGDLDRAIRVLQQHAMLTLHGGGADSAWKSTVCPRPFTILLLASIDPSLPTPQIDHALRVFQLLLTLQLTPSVILAATLPVRLLHDLLHACQLVGRLDQSVVELSNMIVASGASSWSCELIDTHSQVRGWSMPGRVE